MHLIGVLCLLLEQGTDIVHLTALGPEVTLGGSRRRPASDCASVNLDSLSASD